VSHLSATAHPVSLPSHLNLSQRFSWQCARTFKSVAFHLGHQTADQLKVSHARPSILSVLGNPIFNKTGNVHINVKEGSVRVNIVVGENRYYKFRVSVGLVIQDARLMRQSSLQPGRTATLTLNLNISNTVTRSTLAGSKELIT
jgi:hypothetical protein